jgi:HPt (histidine-containing phosphotransfer) domain-containing protein
MTQATATVNPTNPSPTECEPLALLEDQAGLYRQLHALSSKQGDLVDGQPDALLAVLAQRQGLIDRLMECNRRMQPYRDRWSEVTAAMAPAQRQRMGELLGQIDNFRRAIAGQDDQDCRRLTQARGELARELARVSHSGQAARAYHSLATGAASSRFTDRRG